MEPGWTAATTLSIAEGVGGTALSLTSTRTSRGVTPRTVGRTAAHHAGDQHTFARQPACRSPAISGGQVVRPP